jgi:hypothetical protein
MKRFTILLFLVICFSNSCFGQNSKINVERYFENLQYRVYYFEGSLITDTEYKFYFYDIDFRREYNPAKQVFKISNTDLYGSLFEVNNFYYWVPHYSFNLGDQLKIELPGTLKMELTHNHQPLVSNQHAYDLFRKELSTFSYDMFLVDHYTDRMRANDNQIVAGLLVLGLGALSYMAFTSESESRIENVAIKSGGILSASLSVIGIVNIFRSRKQFKNYSNKRDDIIQKYN